MTDIYLLQFVDSLAQKCFVTLIYCYLTDVLTTKIVDTEQSDIYNLFTSFTLIDSLHRSE